MTALWTITTKRHSSTKAETKHTSATCVKVCSIVIDVSPGIRPTFTGQIRYIADRAKTSNARRVAKTNCHICIHDSTAIIISATCKTYRAMTVWTKQKGMGGQASQPREKHDNMRRVRLTTNGLHVSCAAGCASNNMFRMREDTVCCVRPRTIQCSIRCVHSATSLEAPAVCDMHQLHEARLQQTGS